MTLQAQIQQAILNQDDELLEQLLAEEEVAEGEDNSDIETEGDELDSETEDAIEGEEAEQQTEVDGQTEAVAEGEQEAATSEESKKATEVETGSQPAELDESKITFDANGNAVIPKELLSVIAKDGKHNLPYGVVEGARERAKELSAKLEQERQLREKAEGELQKNGRLATALKKQLEKNGIDPEELPEDLKLTDELLDSLDEYGEVGKVIKALVAKQQQIPASASAPQAVTQQPDNSGANAFKSELDDYTQKNPEFAQIFNGSQGDDHFDTLDLFYRQVDKDPEFNGKPLHAKLDAAMERYHKIYPGAGETATDSANPNKDVGEQVSDDALQQAAQAKIKEAQESSAPASPSEVGNTAAKQKNNFEQAESMNAEELLNFMESLSPEELERFQEQCF